MPVAILVVEGSVVQHLWKLVASEPAAEPVRIVVFVVLCSVDELAELVLDIAVVDLEADFADAELEPDAQGPVAVLAVEIAVIE